MAQDIILNGIVLEDVPALKVPKDGGGYAKFDDTTDADATAADIISGKTAYVDGVKLTGTGSGGGGGSNWTLLKSKEYTINTADTSATSVENIELDLADLDDLTAAIWVHIRDKAGKRNGYFYGSDSIILNYREATNAIDSVSTKPYVVFSVDSSGKYTASSSAYGVYARNIHHTSANHYIEIYRRYNSTISLTINGTFKVDIYKLAFPSGFTLFS